MIIKSGNGSTNFVDATMAEVLAFLEAEAKSKPKDQDELIRQGFAEWQGKQDAKFQRLDAKHVAKRY